MLFFLFNNKRFYHDVEMFLLRRPLDRSMLGEIVKLCAKFRFTNNFLRAEQVNGFFRLTFI